MARYFLDSSVLAKRYHPELGTADIQALLASSGNLFLISRLSLVEVQSSFARRVRENVISEADFDQLRIRLYDDVSSGLLRVLSLGSHRLTAAAMLMGAQGLIHSLRTLDAIHLATAIAFHRRRPLAAFISADRQLLTVAAACNLPVTTV